MGSAAKIKLHGAVLDTTVLDRITAQMKPRAREIVNKYGLAIASEAAQVAPVDTGALRNSILSESKMIEDLTFRVSDGVEYGVYQEFGTSRMRAQPFMRFAIDVWANKFINEFKRLFA